MRPYWASSIGQVVPTPARQRAATASLSYGGSAIHQHPLRSIKNKTKIDPLKSIQIHDDRNPLKFIKIH